MEDTMIGGEMQMMYEAIAALAYYIVAALGALYALIAAPRAPEGALIECSWRGGARGLLDSMTLARSGDSAFLTAAREPAGGIEPEVASCAAPLSALEEVKEIFSRGGMTAWCRMPHMPALRAGLDSNAWSLSFQFEGDGPTLERRFRLDEDQALSSGAYVHIREILAVLDRIKDAAPTADAEAL